MQKEIELFIPDGLDIESLIPHSLKGASRERYRDRMVYMLHTIVSRLSTKKVFDTFLDTGYVRLMRVYLNSIMGTQTSDIIKNLETRGVLKVDPVFEIGSYSMGYILTDYYLNMPLKKVTLNSYQTIKTYRSIQQTQKLTQQKLSVNMRKAIHQLEKPWKMDTAGVADWIDQFESKLFRRIDDSEIIPSAQKPDIITKYRQYYQYIQHISNRINKGATEWVIDPKGYRLHTVFTSLPRPVKNFLTYDGGNLATIDIKNSQPFLFGWMAKSRFWSTEQGKDKYGEEFTLHRIGRELHREIIKNNKASRNTIIRMLKTRETIDSSGLQELNFISLCEKGEIYEYIMEHFQGRYFEGSIDRFGDRGLTKQEVMRIMYFDTKKEKVPFYAPFKRFAELFPVEANIMRLIKSNGYKELPILLQRIESKLMLEKVAEKMPKEVPFLTIHDSLIIPDNNQTITDTTLLIQDEIMRHLSIRPRVSKPEVLRREQAFKMTDSYVSEKVTRLEMRFHSRGKSTVDLEDTIDDIIN